MDDNMMNDSMLYEQPDEYSTVERQQRPRASATSVAPAQGQNTLLGSVTNTARSIVNMSLFSVVMLLMIVSLSVLGRFTYKRRQTLAPEWKMQFFIMGMLLVAGMVYSGASISQEADNDKQRQQILLKLDGLGAPQ